MPGKRHVISGILNDFGDRDAIFDQLLQIARDSGDRGDLYIRRNLEYIEKDPGCFTVKVHKDGRKMHGLKRQESAQDPPVECSICRYNRERGTIVVESQDSNGTATFIQCFLFLNDPLRVEFWVDSNGEHHGDDSVATLLQQRWLHPLAVRLAKGPASVHESVASPSGDWKSAMSGPLDAVLTHKGLLAALARELRVPPEGFFVVTSRELASGPGAAGYEQTLSNGTASITAILRMDSTKDSASWQANHGGVHLVTKCYAVHRDPLRLECWIEYDSGRVKLGSACAANELQDMVSRLFVQEQRTCHLL